MPLALRDITIWAIAAAVLAGCGRRSTADRVPVFPVSGKVMYQGKPAAGVTVILHPLGGGNPTTPSATSGADGSFKLATYGPGDGAPEGDYVVTAAWRETADSGSDAPEIDRFRGRYIDPARSKLKVHIQSGPTELPPFEFQ